MMNAGTRGIFAPARGELQLHNVTCTFDRGAPVLERVSLTVKQGKRVAIVGPSGVGKSTIAVLLARSARPFCSPDISTPTTALSCSTIKTSSH